MAALKLFYRAGCQSEWDIISRLFSCQEATVRRMPDIPKWGFAFQQDGASRTRHRRFPGAKGARLHFFNTVAAEFIRSEPSRLHSKNDYVAANVVRNVVLRYICYK